MRTDNASIVDQFQDGSPQDRADAKGQLLAHLRGELDGLLGLVEGKAERLGASKRIDPDSAEQHAVEVLTFARYVRAAELAVQVHQTLGLGDMSRIDMIIDDAGGIQILEANATAGNIALRNWKNAYDFACWIACPTSCAPTAVDATETPR